MVGVAGSDSIPLVAASSIGGGALINSAWVISREGANNTNQII